MKRAAEGQFPCTVTAEFHVNAVKAGHPAFHRW
jgi:hypothetical protein